MTKMTPLLLVAAAAAGCQAPTPADPPAWALESRPLLTAEGDTRSLAFAPRAVREEQADAHTAWYASRSDERIAAEAGITYPTVIYSETHTYDHQATYFGEPRIHYDRRTYRSESVRGVR